MKKNFLLLICFVTIFISLSCDDSFNPKAPFKEQYVLNCIIRGDSSSQIAILSKTYDVSGFDPNSNNIDPSISGSQVYLKWKGTLYQLKDSSIARSDTSKYKDPIKFYYTKAFTPAANDSIEITAIPAPGVLLSSKTKVPHFVSYGNSPWLIKGDEIALDFHWTAYDLNVYYLPRMNIIYQKRDEIPVVTHSFEVPLDYSSVNGIETPVYPGLSPAAGIEFIRANIDKAILQVSNGDIKSNYKFLWINLEILIFDQFLAGYISTTNGFLDNLSIRLDEPNYTNMSGGLGIFGAYEHSVLQISLFDQYLENLGYTP
jgi:hypothetical protein